MPEYSLRHLSDDAVSLELNASTAADNRSIAAHLARIGEFDRRELYLPLGFKSMYRYCVGRLGMSEDVAVHRIRTARVARMCPQVFHAVAEGRLRVTAVSLIAKHLTRANTGEVLATIAGMTNKQVIKLMAERFGGLARVWQAPVPAATPALEHIAADATPTEQREIMSPASMRVTPAQVIVAASKDEPLCGEPVACDAARPAPRSRVTPIAPGLFELVAILGKEAYDQLMESCDLLGHAVPSGELAEVLARAIALQHEHLCKRRCATVARPRKQAPGPVRATQQAADPRHVPDAVRRAVWKRDGGRCAFVGTEGHRCEERGRLELDHVVPVARGGRSTVENLRLLCRAHNQFAAEQALGKQHVVAQRERARRRRTAERLAKQAERERAEARRAEIARQREELGEAFRMLGYRGHDLERALAYCACRAEAPPEERLRNALSCMAPKARREQPPMAGAA